MVKHTKKRGSRKMRCKRGGSLLSRISLKPSMEKKIKANCNDSEEVNFLIKTLPGIIKLLQKELERNSNVKTINSILNGLSNNCFNKVINKIDLFKSSKSSRSYTVSEKLQSIETLNDKDINKIITELERFKTLLDKLPKSQSQRSTASRKTAKSVSSKIQRQHGQVSLPEHPPSQDHRFTPPKSRPTPSTVIAREIKGHRQSLPQYSLDHYRAAKDGKYFVAKCNSKPQIIDEEEVYKLGKYNKGDVIKQAQFSTKQGKIVKSKFGNNGWVIINSGCFTPLN